MNKQKPAFFAGLVPYQAAGLLALLISFAIHLIGVAAGLDEDQFFAIFVFNYLISGTYFCLLWFRGRFRSGRSGLELFFLSLLLFLISAYALNHIIPVFELSTGWLNLLLIVTGLAYAALGFFHKLGSWGRACVTFCLGIGCSLFLYLSIYLLPLYPVSVPAAVALGISLHSFCPLLFVIFTLIWLFRTTKQYRRVLHFFLCGVACVLLVVLAFCLQWNQLDRQVAARYQQGLIDEDDSLPAWIKVAQELPHNWFAEAYLKTGLVYSAADHSADWFNWGLPSRKFDEVRKHDPLIMIATFFNARATLNEEERIKILEAEFDGRHKAEDRLWSGRELSTDHVISNIRIWPQFRMAYTEKTITVGQRPHGRSWRRDEEAIYTFQLPEGGVVTSLSLWIDGVEAKGVLTTKGKADSAYRQIVGTEVRDPSVVHWREGNRVSVRVFPIPAGGNRIFRIGITAPLAYRKDGLHYENIYFEGPDASSAKEIVQVDWAGKPAKEAMAGFTAKNESRFIREGSYRKDWQLIFPTPPLSAGHFNSFGYSYHIAPYVPERRAVAFSRVYLDVNASWTEKEFKALLEACKEVPVYVYDDGLLRVTADKAPEYFSRLRRKHFTLFPFQVISDPAAALLVTKSGKRSPDVGDLKATGFAAALEAWMDRGEKLCLFNLGTELDPYLRTLKEHRAFRYEQGDMQLLLERYREKSFAADTEDDDHVVINNAAVVLGRTTDTLKGQAPDHFQRLFAYNHLMRQLGKGLFRNRETDTTLVQEAQQAYVVTPLSSLVVLETKADYERFGIEDSKSSLQNASLHSKGAVPEPGEWALIIVAVVLALGTFYQHKLRKLWKPQP